MTQINPSPQSGLSLRDNNAMAWLVQLALAPFVFVAFALGIYALGPTLGWLGYFLASILGAELVQQGQQTTLVVHPLRACLFGLSCVLVLALAGAASYAGNRFLLARLPALAQELLRKVLLLLLVAIFFGAVESVLHYVYGGRPISFWTVENLRTIGVQTATVAMAALGMTLIIIAGGIDLSVGTTVALCATVLADCLLGKQGYMVGSLALVTDGVGLGSALFENPTVCVTIALACCLGAGFLAGLLNGTLISLLRVVPFIVTLGTMTAFLGLGKIIANETTVRPPLDMVPWWIPAMVVPNPNPEWLIWPVVPNFGWGVWLVLAAAVIMALVLHLTVFGRHVFALGSNEATARLCGINVTLAKVLVYAVAGLFVGLAGVFQFARLSSGSPTSGIGLELKIIAAVVIGGGSLSGGRGSVVGTLTGAAIMITIATGGTALGLSNPVLDIIIGVIIVAAVTLDQYRQRRLAAG